MLNEEGELQLVISSFSDITQHRKLILQFNEQEIIRQKQLLQVTIDAQEKERREIGRELHDNISQHLTITRLHLEVAKEMAQGPLSEAINLAHKSLLGIVNEIRILSHSLVPPSINDIGLIASVQDLCDSLVSSGSYILDFNHEGFTEEVMPENMRLTLYRIIQEQINNIMRHSEASRIFISLQIVDDTILLFVEDNGKGFEPKKVRKGMGFTNISNRAGLFGGLVRIDSAPGKGCVIEVEIPVLGQ
jgi:signal transduction histidine kinase